MHARLALLAAFLASAQLAGCVEDDDPVSPAAVDHAADVASEVREDAQANATLPDGRGESAGIAETNRTEEGLGGVEHKHDYWQGRELVILLQTVVDVISPPLMPDGQGTQPRAVGYVKLGKLPDGSGGAALVYEGADRVEVSFAAPVVGPPAQRAPHPAPPRLFLQYRSAADVEWSAPAEVTYGAPIRIDVEPTMTDMPHSTHSLWVFRVTSERPERMGVPMMVSVHKGRDVVDWPGHPDFYAQSAKRVVMEQRVTTRMNGAEALVLYDAGGSWVAPEKLISWGTREIHVFVNVTSVRSAAGLAPTGYFLEAHNATVIGPEVTYGSRHRDVDGHDDLASYHFALVVDDAGMDGPYQPSSRWGFRMMAMFGDVDGVIGLCPGCFPYDIEYDITIVALSYETGSAQAMEHI